MTMQFNTTFYLQNNPDVLAAVAQGLTTAAEHFASFGRFEGRNPNAFFDTNFYLTSNPDVLDAGVNPLEHFLTFGAAEGRQPSTLFPTLATFDTAAYAAANADLAAAGITTAEALYGHFVTFGFLESRSGVQTTTGAPITIDTGTSGVVGESFVLTTAVGERLVGTGNNDTFSGTVDVNGLGATPAATLNPTDTIDGLGGTDTFNITSTSGSATIPAGSTRNVEIVNLISDTPTDGFTTVDAGSFSGAQQVWQIGAQTSAAVTGVTNSVTVGFNAGSVADLVMAKDATTANIALANVADAGTINVAEVDSANDGKLATVNVNGSVAGAGTLTIDLDTAAGVGGVVATKEATVNLGLTSDGTITINSGSLKTVDASASTGDLTIATPATVTALKGGSGDDTLDAAASTSAVAIEGGAGKDTIFAGTAGSTIIGGAGMDTMIAGAGADTFVINAGDSTRAFATIDQILNFDTGTDKLDFNLAAGSAANFLSDASSTGFVDGLTNANTSFDGTVQYFLATGIDDVDPNTDMDQFGALLFVDSDLNGTADFAVAIQGTTPVFGDIIA